MAGHLDFRFRGPGLGPEFAHRPHRFESRIPSDIAEIR